MEMTFQNLLPQQINTKKTMDVGARPKAYPGKPGRSKFSEAMGTLRKQQGEDVKDAEDAERKDGIFTVPMEENGVPQGKPEEAVTLAGIASEQIFNWFMQREGDGVTQPEQIGITALEGQETALGAVSGEGIPSMDVAQQNRETAKELTADTLLTGAQQEAPKGEAVNLQAADKPEQDGYAAELGTEIPEKLTAEGQEKLTAVEEKLPDVEASKQARRKDAPEQKERQNSSQTTSRIWEGDRQAGVQTDSVERRDEARIQHFTWNTADNQKNVERLSKITEQMRAGRQQSLELQLEPAELGKILIQATYKSGKASVVITCESEKTMYLLSRCAQELGGILKEHTGEQTMVFVETSQEDYTNREDSQQREQQPDGRQKKKEHETGDDFLQQLRLGILQQA